jgi:hypothetical protein
VPDSEFVIACDTLKPAIGQAPATTFWRRKNHQPARFLQDPIPNGLLSAATFAGSCNCHPCNGDGRLAAMEMLDDLGFRLAETGNSYYRN